MSDKINIQSISEECSVCHKTFSTKLNELGDEEGKICDDCFTNLSYHMCDNCDLSFSDTYCFWSWLNDDVGNVQVICDNCYSARRLTHCSECQMSGQRKHFVNLETRGRDYEPVWKCKDQCHGIGFGKQPKVLIQ